MAQSREDAVVEAAVAWVEHIVDHPNSWAGEEDFALIETVQSLTGATYPWESERG